MNVLKSLLLFSAILFFFGSVSAAVLSAVTDLNVDAPAVTGTYISPAVNSFDVVWWYEDANFVAATHDVNLYLHISTTSGDLNEAILSDVNADTYCAVLTSTINYNNATKCSYTISTVLNSSDGNYVFDINMMNVVDSTDNNSILTASATFVLDQTPPTVTITSGQVATNANYNLTYTGSDATAGIKKYWVSADNSTWIDNGLNTSRVFTASIGTSTYYVKAQDFADNNSSTASVSAERSGGGTSAYCGDGTCNWDISETSISCPEDCASVCGDGSCTNEENASSCPADCGPSVVCGNGVCDEGETTANCKADCLPKGLAVKEVVLSKIKTGKPSADDITQLLTIAGASETAIKKASAAAGRTGFKRKVEVVKETNSSGKESFSTSITITVSNTSGKTLKGVKVVEQIPKSVAQDASEITSNLNFRVLLDDPIVEFTVPELLDGEEVNLSYSVAAKVTETQVNEFALPVTADFTEEETNSCSGVICNDNNLCTSDSCSGGNCIFAPVSDGTVCGFGKVCNSGNCVAQETTPTNYNGTTNQTPAADYTLLIVVLVILAIIGGFYYYNNKK